MTGVNPDITAYYGAGGYFVTFITPPSRQTVDVTFFRGAPTKITNMSFADPFGPTTLQLSIPQMTAMERGGQGDLRWLVPFADVDIYYYDLNTGEYSDWSWEGYIVSEEIGLTTRTITCKGSFYQLDHFLAAPQFPQQPIPYELLIKDAFDPANNPSLRTSSLRVDFPGDWNEKVPVFNNDYPWYLKPWGVTAGENWTGITTRSTGSWEPKLTGFVQTLLSVMYTPDGGQWTVMHEKGRRPVLKVRPALRQPTDKTFYVNVGAHGVDMSVSRDFSQSVNVVYAQGTDLAGTSFSGQKVSNDGSSTWYEPFAAQPHVYPSTDTNPRLMPHMMRKETMMQLPQGIAETAARTIAQTQVRKHADPGYTGTITLTTDPRRDGLPVSKYLIRAGDTICVEGLTGTSVLFHIAAVSLDIEGGKTTLTVDSKFRDALTVDEVHARTRDALDPVRALQVGKFSTTVQDLVKPWSYAEGSGVIPSGGNADATALFTKLMGEDAQFPWTNYTTKYPPKDYPEYYIKVPKRTSNSNNSWSRSNRNGQALGIPVKMSQAGTIRLSQIAAYDKHGNVKPVSFHVGIYGSSGVSYQSMPSLPQAWLDSTDAEAKRHKSYGFQAGQYNPFFRDAFEQVLSSGEQQSQPNYLPASNVNQVVAWGNYYERAGYSPGLMSVVGRNNPTGRLVDEQSWSYDTTSSTDFDPYSAENTAKNENAGMLYVMIFCEDNADEDVYFLGRLWRSEATS